MYVFTFFNVRIVLKQYYSARYPDTVNCTNKCVPIKHYNTPTCFEEVATEELVLLVDDANMFVPPTY